MTQQNKLDDWVIIYAEEGEEFQQYCYPDGEPIEPGTPIGIESESRNELHLLYYARYA
jgi:hypothetical protein